VPIERGDTEETLQERVKVAEHRAFPQALEMLARGDIYLDEHGQVAWNDYLRKSRDGQEI
jgi:phosphoribosylamine--glycine ligase/phosphoribosylglycinamide formyltransferase/phosphoribosylformylglycinamidine cyclo-ligase